MSEKSLMETTPLAVRADSSPRFLLRVAVVFLLVVAAGLRLVALDQYPTPLHQDELSDIYDGYSLATTGCDRSGESWPILVRGMGPGDYHPGLYAYLAAASTSIGGFSVWWGRLPAALAGITTVVLVWLTGRRFLGEAGGLLALAFITFSPIHVLYSRQAHQGACLVPLFVILCVYTLRRGLDWVDLTGVPGRRWSILLCGFIIGFSTNCYAGQRVTALLWAAFAVLVIGVRIAGSGGGWGRVWYAAGAFVVAVAFGAAPQLFAALADPARFFARGETTFFRLANGPRWWAETLGANLLANLHPRYLFLSFGDYHVLSIARLSVVTLPFFYVGLLTCCLLPVFRRRLDLAWIPAMILFCLLPGLATEGQPSPMRTAGVWALYPIVAAQGVLHLWNVGAVFRAALGWGGTVVAMPTTGGCGVLLRAVKPAALIVAAITINGGLDVYRYATCPALQGRAAQPHFRILGEWVRERGAGYDRVYVTGDGLFGYLYMAAFSGMKPMEYRDADREGVVSGYGWDKYTRFGRFFFRSYEDAVADWNESSREGRWLVLTAEGPFAEFDPAQHASAMPRR